jgi:RNA polymerase sigma-70 factor (ECF subfamily)
MNEGEDDRSRIQRHVWVWRARQGDRAAFQCLVDEYDRRLLYFMRRFERDPHRALELVQDVWLTVFRRIGKLEFPNAFRTWLYRIAHAQAVNAVRRKVREPLCEPLMGNDIPMRNSASTTDEAELVHRALEQISPEHREVLLLHFLEGMPLAEIGEILDCPAGTVKSRMHYAKQALRSAIEEMDHDKRITP